LNVGLLDKGEIGIDWFIVFIGNFLNVGPAWAEAFAKLTLRHLQDLRVLEKISVEPMVFRVVKSRINAIHNKALKDYKSDRSELFLSINKRGAGLKFTSTFLETFDSMLQNLCLNFGKQVAEWFHRGIGREINRKNIHDIIPLYFANFDAARKAAELVDLIFDSPSEKEIPYIYRLLSAAFLLNSIKLEPSATRVLKETVSCFELYLDSNILLPLLIKEHRNHRWISWIIKMSLHAGASIAVIEDIFTEVLSHKDVAQQIWKVCNGNKNNLSTYSDSLGIRANCFIQGFINQEKNEWNKYLQQYSPTHLRNNLLGLGIRLAPVQVKNHPLFKKVLSAIEEEWNQRQSISPRREELNENEAKQFLQIYERRQRLAEEGKTQDVWFLSYETVLGKVYLRDPQLWGKPPTFPVSAWASFLDSYLMPETKNRSHMLNAILKGNSTAYDLPDAETIVRRRAFGKRMLTDSEYEALKFVTSNGGVVNRLEKAREAMIRRSQTACFQDYEEATKELVAEINMELSENIAILERRLRETQEASAQEIKKWKQEIEKLKASKRRRFRPKRKLNNSG